MKNRKEKLSTLMSFVIMGLIVFLIYKAFAGFMDDRYRAGYNAGRKSVQLTDLCEEVGSKGMSGNFQTGKAYDFVECRFNIHNVMDDWEFEGDWDFCNDINEDGDLDDAGECEPAVRDGKKLKDGGGVNVPKPSVPAPKPTKSAEETIIYMGV